ACPSFLHTHPPTSEFYTLSLHDALPIFLARRAIPSSSRRLLLLLPVSGPGKRTEASPCTTPAPRAQPPATRGTVRLVTRAHAMRSEEHTSELQSRENLVCRLLLEKKKTT